MRTVYRLNLSPYQCENFQEQENTLITGLGLNYISSQSDGNYKELKSKNILISNTHTRFDKIPSDTIENCELILHPNSGYDNFSIEFLNKYPNIKIVLGNTIRSKAVASYILSSFFSHYSPIPSSKTWKPGREWKRNDISSLNILLLGHGHIGKMIEQALKPLVNNVFISDPHKDLEIDLNSNFLNTVDCIIPTMSLNESSEGLLDKTFFQSLKESALIINGARGKLIQQNELINYLKSNKEAFAFLDVFEKEPCDFAIFNGIENVKLTSHIAGVHNGLDKAILDFEMKVINDHQKMEEKEFLIKYNNLNLRKKMKGNILI
tara:strand:- start:196841 stop:197803 length:963 start_codon:yes stop_codon:yes gene_type:complete